MNTGTKVFVAVAGMIALALIIGSGAIMVRLVTQPDPSVSAQQVPTGTADPSAQGVPEAVIAPTAAATASATLKDIKVDSGWLDKTAGATGIPRRALQAYVGATLWASSARESCGLQWNTLAGIGAVESDHGRMAGGQIEDSGDMSESLVGPRLDGSSGVRRITDTDFGRLDGDDQFDRAVGPMQFIPSSWKSSGKDGNGDGKADPNNIDDAALSAAGYLCQTGNLSTSEGWDRAVRSYNQSDEYVNRVFGSASRIARIVSPGAPAPAPKTVQATP